MNPSFEKSVSSLHFRECRYHIIINYSKMLKDLYITPLIQKPLQLSLCRLLNNLVFQHGGINACLLDMPACFLNSDPLLIHRGTVFRR